MRLFIVISLFAIVVGCSKPYEPSPQSTEADRTGASGDAPAASDTQPVNEENATGGAETTTGGGESDGSIKVGSIRMTAPEGWVKKAPRSTFVQAEFALPKAEGDEADGRLTVSMAGGSIEANVDRWRGQFGGNPKKDVQDSLDVAGLKVTIVDLAGTYNDQPGPLAPGVQREGYRMLAAIVPGDGQQLHFIKAYGPEKTIAAHEEKFRQFVDSIQQQ